MSEGKRNEYSYWRKSKDIFLAGIDRNEMLPAATKQELKNLISEHFQLMSKTVATTELIYLREKQHQ